jgi:leucyl aminopeptidase (aminopeptidase T)
MSEHFIELGKAAYKTVKDICDVRPGEDVLVYDDSAADHRVIEAIAAAAHAVGGKVTLCTYETPPGVCMEPPEPVAAAMKNADVLIENSVQYILYSRAQEESLKLARVYFILAGYNVDDFVRMVGKVNYPSMIEFGELLTDMTQKAKKVRVTSKAGTDVEALNNGREVTNAGGIYNMPKRPLNRIMPAGQIAWCPLEETINGTIVYDGYLWPPDEIGALPKPPVKVTVKKGVIVDIEQNANGVVFKKWLDSFKDPKMYRIAHYTYGTCPTAELKPTTKIAEGERYFGNFEWGMGMQGPAIGGKSWSAASHCDGTAIAVSVYLDGEQIEENGKFIHPELAKLAKKMGVKGY